MRFLAKRSLYSYYLLRYVTERMRGDLPPRSVLDQVDKGIGRVLGLGAGKCPPYVPPYISGVRSPLFTHDHASPQTQIHKPVKIGFTGILITI